MVDLTRYKIFSKSVKAEYYTDKIWSKRVYGSDEVLFRTDHTYKIIKSVKILKTIFCFAKFLWLFILFARNVLMFFRCVKKITRRKLTLNLNGAAVCLNLTARASALFEKNCKHKNKIILQFPWLAMDPKINLSSFNAVALLDIGLLLKIFCESFNLSYLVIIKNKNPGRFFFLQTYDSFNWLVAYYVLDKIRLEKGVEIYLSNQMDRWAVLAMYFSKKIPTHLIMHGVLDSNCFDRRYNFVGIVKNFQSIYYFKTSYEFICDNIKNKKLQYFELKTNFELQEVSHNKKSILWVGGPASDHGGEMVLFSQLNFDYFHVYYKPHPHSPNFKQKNIQGIEYINDIHFFPKVDVVVSVYHSTLLDEYAIEKIPNFILDNQERINIFKNFLSRVDSVCAE